MAARNSPYPGLDPYTAAEADLFVGREETTRFLAATVRTRRLTILYGESGVGKTSLVQAGVAPMLAKTEGSIVIVFRDWIVPDARARLLEAVRKALSAEAAPIPDAADTRIFLLCDQFEDHFLNRSERGWFGETLGQILRARIAINVVLSVRSDAMYLLEPMQDQVPNLFSNSIKIEPLSEADARRAITEPLTRYKESYAAAAGVRMKDPPIEPGLEDLIIQEVAAKGGIEAAILQIVLSRLWQEEKDSLLGVQLRKKTLQEKLQGVGNIAFDYVKAGVADAADKISAKQKKPLQDDVRRVCSWAFRRLVSSSGRSVPYSEEELRNDAPADLRDLVGPVLQNLLDARVLKPISSGAGPPLFAMRHDILAGAVIRWVADYDQQLKVRDEIRDTKKSAQKYSIGFWMSIGFAMVLALAGYLTQQQRAANDARVQIGELQARLNTAASQLTTSRQEVARATSAIAARDVRIEELHKRVEAPQSPVESAPAEKPRSNGMLKSLDILIGFTLVILLASMAVTMVTQAVNSLLRIRAMHLQRGIADLLLKISPALGPETSGKIAREVLTHNLIGGPGQPGTVIHREELIGILLDIADREGTTHNVSLRAALAAEGIPDPAMALKRIRDVSLQLELKNPELANHVRSELAILQTASTDFVAKVHAWFDSTMDRVSDRFTHRTRQITFAAAVLVAVVFQLDTIGLLNRLAVDDALRDALSVQAQAIAKSQVAATDQSQSLPPQTPASLSKALQETQVVVIPHSFTDWNTNWKVVNPLGIALTALLLTLGAPFWYSTLQQLIRLRPLIAAKDDQQRESRQQTSPAKDGE